MLLDGLCVPLLAPFYRDGALYLRKLEHNVDRLSRTPAAGLVAFTDAGEGTALTDRETAEALASITALAAKEKVLLAALRRDSLAAALELAAAAREARFDAVVVGVPAGWRLLERPRGGFLRQLETWFAAVADRSPLPVVLANGGDAAGGPLPLALIGELARHPNVIGLAEEALDAERLLAVAAAPAGVERDVTVTTVFAAVTGRMLAAEAVGPATFVAADALSAGGAAVAVAAPAPALRTRVKRVGFQVLAAGGGPMLPVLAAGVRALLPTLAAAAPQACHEVLAAFRDGDPALAAEKEARLAEAQRVVVDELGVAALKYAADRNGYTGGAPRLPLLPLTGDDRARVDAAMQELRS